MVKRGNIHIELILIIDIAIARFALGLAACDFGLASLIVAQSQGKYLYGDVDLLNLKR